MPFALIHGLSEQGDFLPIEVQGVNTESSFYTDGPSITAAAGFVGMLCELDGLKPIRKGKIRRGIDVQAGGGFAFFIHHYDRQSGKVAFNAAVSDYVDRKKKLVNPPIPYETHTANMSFSLVLKYSGSLPGNRDELECLLNARSRRFNGGSIMSDIMITDISEQDLVAYARRYGGHQVVDHSDLGLTLWDELLEYVSFSEHRQTKSKTSLWQGIFYLHQTGYQLLEDPCEREGVLLNGDQSCLHAFCEPVINLAGLEHTRLLKTFSDLQLWQWQENIEQRTILLTKINRK